MALRSPLCALAGDHGRSILTAGQRLDNIMGTTTSTAPPSRAQTRPGTYFLSLTVENVRCFGPAQTLNLSDGHGHHSQWTVILGENGLGKTTLLTCLAYFASAAYAFGYLADRKSEMPRPYLGEWISGVETLKRASGDGEGRIEAVIGLSDGPRKAAEAQITLQRSGFMMNPAVMVPQYFTFHYGASRRMPQGKSLAQYDKRVGIFLDDDVALRDPEDWFLKADYNVRLRASDAERFASFARGVQGTLIDILPEVSELRIQSADEPGGSPRVEAKTPDGWVPLRRLGFGYQSQIAWLVDFASRMFERYPDSPDPLAEPAVVLVDEIDLHMHPRWQRQIIGYLTERCPNTQFIVTAHSPLVVQAAAGANIVLLRREGDHVVIDNDREVMRNWRVDQILTSELFGLDTARPPQIEAPLKERRALLAKPRLTSRDRARLAELEAQIGELPAGESAEDRRAMELIRRAAEKLQSGS
jgi:energy-coupling factor transporter ATP-binding protein EcfA2